MKKKLLVIVSAAMISAMALTGCGGDSNKNTEPAPTATSSAPAESAAPSESAAPAESEAPAESAAPSTSATLEEYFAASDAKEQMDSVLSQFENDMMSMAFDVEGNSMIYTLTFKTDMGLTKESFGTAMNDAVEAQKGAFVQMADTLKAEAGIEDVTVVIKYIDHKGDELYTLEIESEN